MFLILFPIKDCKIRYTLAFALYGMLGRKEELWCQPLLHFSSSIAHKEIKMTILVILTLSQPFFSKLKKMLIVGLTPDLSARIIRRLNIDKIRVHSSLDLFACGRSSSPLSARGRCRRATPPKSRPLRRRIGSYLPYIRVQGSRAALNK